jgi:hypothetical protein
MCLDQLERSLRGKAGIPVLADKYLCAQETAKKNKYEYKCPHKHEFR